MTLVEAIQIIDGDINSFLNRFAIAGDADFKLQYLINVYRGNIKDGYNNVALKGYVGQAEQMKNKQNA